MTCPIQKTECSREDCELWVKLYGGDKSEIGRCTFSWITFILTEIRQALSEIKNERRIQPDDIVQT